MFRRTMVISAPFGHRVEFAVLPASQAAVGLPWRTSHPGSTALAA